jgi:hypothetical protein
MLTRKPCKYCGSFWHSKNKCENKPQNVFKPVKRVQTPLSAKKPVQGLRTGQRGKSERSKLTLEADKVFGAFIRSLSEYCYTCTRKVEGLQCGHFMSRRYVNTRWSEMNCHPQCTECNVVKGGNLVVYEQRLRAEYGDEAIDTLKQLARSGNKVSLAEIQGVIDKYGE